MRRPLASFLLLVGVLLSTQVNAQEFPSKPVHLMVGAAPGGLIDLFARTYGTKLQERSGQPVLVENNSVATGTIGAGLVAKSAPDGYMLIMGHPANMTIWPIINPNLSYDTRKDFAPIALNPVRWPEGARIALLFGVSWETWPDDLGTNASHQRTNRGKMPENAIYKRDMGVV